MVFFPFLLSVKTLWKGRDICKKYKLKIYAFANTHTHTYTQLTYIYIFSVCLGCLYDAFFALIYARAILWRRRALNCGRILASHNYWIIWIYVRYIYTYIHRVRELIYCELIQRVESTNKPAEQDKGNSSW